MLWSFLSSLYNVSFFLWIPLRFSLYYWILAIWSWCTLLWVFLYLSCLEFFELFGSVGLSFLSNLERFLSVFLQICYLISLLGIKLHVMLECLMLSHISLMLWSFCTFFFLSLSYCYALKLTDISSVGYNLLLVSFSDF